MKKSWWIGAAIAALFVLRQAQARIAPSVDASSGAELQPNLPALEFQEQILPDAAFPRGSGGDYLDPLGYPMHFTLAEFTASRTAAAQGIDNTLPSDLEQNALDTLTMLERIREYLSGIAGGDVPIIIQSGYRSPTLNAAVGGSSRSDHLQAMAADWIAPTFGSAFAVAAALAPVVDQLGIGQLINEFPGPRGWVHTSTRIPDNAANRVITITAQGARAGIVA